MNVSHMSHGNPLAYPAFPASVHCNGSLVWFKARFVLDWHYWILIRTPLRYLDVDPGHGDLAAFDLQDWPLCVF